MQIHTPNECIRISFRIFFLGAHVSRKKENTRPASQLSYARAIGERLLPDTSWGWDEFVTPPKKCAHYLRCALSAFLEIFSAHGLFRQKVRNCCYCATLLRSSVSDTAWTLQSQKTPSAVALRLCTAQSPSFPKLS